MSSKKKKVEIVNVPLSDSEQESGDNQAQSDSEHEEDAVQPKERRKRGPKKTAEDDEERRKQIEAKRRENLAKGRAKRAESLRLKKEQEKKALMDEVKNSAKQDSKALSKEVLKEILPIIARDAPRKPQKTNPRARVEKEQDEDMSPREKTPEKKSRPPPLKKAYQDEDIVDEGGDNTPKKVMRNGRIVRIYKLFD